MTLLPKVKLRVLPTFPSSIIGGTGLTATKANGSVVLDYAWQEFGAISAIPTSPTSYILTYDTFSNTYVMVPSHLLGGGVSGIADAPSDNVLYGRLNAQWVPAAGGSFIQAGAGAVTRTMQDKVRESVSAKDFGAVGDGVADDTAALQAFFQFCITNPVEGFLPPGIYSTIGHDLNLVTPNIASLCIRGAGMGRSIIKLKNGSNTNLLVAVAVGNIATGGGNRNMSFSQLTIDGNCQNQTANSYTTYFAYVKNFTFDHVEFKNAWSLPLWVSQDDKRGSGPTDNPGFVRHLLALPDGEQLNQNVQILNCILDATAQVAPHDIFVAGSIDGLVIRECVVRNAHTAAISVQFCKNFSVLNNDIQNFWWGIYVETSQHGVISGNKIRTLGPLYTSDISPAGIWLVSAIVSYPGYHYSGCVDVKILNNDIYDLAKTTGAQDAYGIRVTGLTTGAEDARRCTIQQNSILNISAVGGGSGIGIGTNGTATQFNISHNNISNVTTGIEQGRTFAWGAETFPAYVYGATIHGNAISNATKGYSQTLSSFTDYTSLVGNMVVSVTTPYSVVAQSHIVNDNNL